MRAASLAFVLATACAPVPTTFPSTAAPDAVAETAADVVPVVDAQGEADDAAVHDTAESTIDAPADVGADIYVDAAADSVAKPHLDAATLSLTLQHGAFPPTADHPSAVAHIPPGFDPTPPLNLVVYLHGWNNCALNVAGAVDSSCNPQAGTPIRPASHLLEQFDAAKRNALLLIPEVKFDAASGDPGALGKSGGFAAMLTEVLKQLAPQLGQISLQQLGQVVVFSHSGAYQPAAAMATAGGVPLTEIALLDSLYGQQAAFQAWIQEDITGFALPTPKRRFASVYTQDGGTLSNNHAFATAAAKWLASEPDTLLDDHTSTTWPPASYQHGVLFKYSALTHHGVTLYYFGQLLKNGGLPTL